MTQQIEEPLPDLRWHDHGVGQWSRHLVLYQRWKVVTIYKNGIISTTFEWRKVEEGPIDD